VTVTGDVLKFDPAEIAKRAKACTIDLPPDLIAKYQGQPVVLATSVIDPKLADLARRAPPPMTPAELAFQKAMRTINPTFMALRGGLAAPNAEQIKEQAATLKTAFGEIETYFKSRNVADATGWAADAIKHSAAIEQGAAAGTWDEVKSAAGSLQQVCATCHKAYREQQDDGSYRIRGGG
jgi:cytochrome c556